jgi:sortase A
VTSLWVVPDDAAGWHVNSARPGYNGNVVLSGHHNMGTEVFRYIVDLKPGDPVILVADGREYTYTVTDRFILPERGVPEAQRRQNAQWIEPTAVERLTLVTCWPYEDNSHRVIVLANPAR